MQWVGETTLAAPAQPSRRLIAGMALSLAVHALLVMGITPAPPRFAVPAPLQVELRPAETPQPAGEFATEHPPEPVVAAPAPAQPESPPVPESPPAVAPPAPVVIALPLEKYYTARELDVRAEPVNEVQLVYPVKAYEMRLPGAVIVRMLINEDGVVDGVTVLEATPPGVFEEAALEATRALMFRPAQKHGRNVKSQKVIEVTFDPYESVRPR